jgi:hypothetical protein
MADQFNIVVYGGEQAWGLGKMCQRGFEAHEHEVAYFAPERRVTRQGTLLQKVPFIERLRPGQNIGERFSQFVADRDPDLVFVVKGYELDTGDVESVQAANDAVVVNWNPDNPFQIRSTAVRAGNYLQSMSVYDVVFTWGKFLMDQLRAEGATDVQYLPFGVDPSYHFPADPRPEYECDVAFFGQWSEKRQEALRSLSGLDLQIRGGDWSSKCRFDRKLRPHIEGKPVMGEEYSKAMSSASIVINVIADHAGSAQNMRTWEVPATKTCMVTTRTREQETFFEDGVSAVMYDKPGDLRETVEYYLDATEERSSIAATGYDVVQGHTYAARMRSVVRALSL